MLIPLREILLKVDVFFVVVNHLLVKLVKFHQIFSSFLVAGSFQGLEFLLFLIPTPFVDLK